MYIYYFSYGHNTNISEFYQRITTAVLVGKATLFDYKFILAHFANIIPHKGSNMKGVLWKIPIDTIKTLDYYEKYLSIYQHHIVNVVYKKTIVQALTYVMTPYYKDNRYPTMKYIKWLYQGYKENNLPLHQLNNALKEYKGVTRS
jgi:hypothetical protein